MEEPTHFPAIDAPVPLLDVAQPFDALLSYPPLKAIVPVLLILALAPFIWLLFRKTWKELDAEAREHQLARTEQDYRPIVCLVLLGMTLTVQDYYGGRRFFLSTIQLLAITPSSPRLFQRAD